MGRKEDLLNELGEIEAKEMLELQKEEERERRRILAEDLKARKIDSRIRATTPLEDQYITKAAAAIEIKKQAKTSFNLYILGIGLLFIVGITTTFNVWAGTVVTVVGCVILGFFAVTAYNKIKYLNSTYGLR